MPASRCVILDYLISHAAHRLKHEHPIEIDKARR